MKKFLKRKDLVILSILVIIIVALLPFYILKIREVILSNKFANDIAKDYSNYTNPVFCVEKIIYYSSAFVSDNSESGNLQKINIGQYTDIAIYINNTKKSDTLTDENTISELYIDDIKVSTNSGKGECLLAYKNPYYFANYKGLEEPENGRIDFNIIKNNKDNKESAYNFPSFYHDCSNPISLGFINKNILTDVTVSNTDTFALNGTILQKSNVPLSDLVFNISFKIHIKNNKNEEFVCNVDRSVLDDSYANSIYTNGYLASQYTPSEGTYQFIKVSN